MSDVTAEMRAWAAVDLDRSLPTMALEAGADEIDRLRAENAELKRKLQVREDYDFQADYPGKIIAAGKRINALTAEIDELKQWVSDACELLHEMWELKVPGPSWFAPIRDLLRRAENP